MTDDRIPLGDVVRALRAEIVESARTAVDEDVRFALGPIELELTVLARREGGGEGRIHFSVLGVGLEGGGGLKVASESTQKVKLTLTPSRTGADGERGTLEISGRPRLSAELSARQPGDAR